MKTIWCMVLVGVLAVGAWGQTDGALVERFDRAEAAGAYARALEAAVELTGRHPESAAWAFNAGRMYARVGRLEEAVAELGRAGGLGYSGIASFEQHADLEVLREREDFRAVLEVVRRNAAERMEGFKAEALKHVPPTHVPKGMKDGKPGLVIALHGTGGTGAGMIESLREACDELGVICVAPDALRPAGEGYSWTYRDEAEWFVEHVVRAAIEAYGADPANVVLVGFSQGANIGLLLARTRGDLFRAVVPVCGHYEPAVAAAVGEGAVPVYLLTGSRDPWKATYTKARADWQAAGVGVRLRVVAGMGHELPGTGEWVRAVGWGGE